MKITLLLGAGFSKWSCGLPLVSELFDFRIRPTNDVEARRVIRLEKLYEDWSRSNPKKNNEAFVKFAQGRAQLHKLVNWYITRRLTDPFIVNSSRRYTWYINSYHAGYHSGIARAAKFIRLVGDYAAEVGIVTTNYDMISEYALGTRRFNYGVVGEQIGFTPYPYSIPVHAKGRTPILKLHGSISWDETRKYPDLRCGLTGKCLIVPPIAEKRAPKQLFQQWAFAKRALSSCNVLVIFGFSFNEYDFALRNYIKRNLNPSAFIIIVDPVDIRRRLRKLLKGYQMFHLSPLGRDWRSKLRAKLKKIGATRPF